MRRMSLVSCTAQSYACHSALCLSLLHAAFIASVLCIKQRLGWVGMGLSRAEVFPWGVIAARAEVFPWGMIAARAEGTEPNGRGRERGDFGVRQRALMPCLISMGTLHRCQLLLVWALGSVHGC